MRRPWYIGLIGWLSIIVGLLEMAACLGLVGILLAANSSDPTSSQGAGLPLPFHMPLSVYLGLAAFISAVVFIDGLFLLKARNWARQLAVALWLIGTAANIYAYGISVITIAHAVFAALVLYALNTSASKRYFSASSKRLTNRM